MIYHIERRKRDPRGTRHWHSISWNLTDKEIADAECEKMNKEDDVFEYIVTEKPE